MLVRAPVIYQEDTMTTSKTSKFIGFEISKANLVIALWGNEEYWQIDNNGPELHKLSQ